MEDTLLLLPQPRRLVRFEGTYTLEENQLVVLNAPDPQALRLATSRLQGTLQAQAGLTLQLSAGAGLPRELAAILLSVVPGATHHPQGYELTISAGGVHVVAGSAAGLFYAVLTLCQIIGQRGRELPLLRINDWPDFGRRGVMLDISRDRVPTLETLFELVDLLASWKVNEFQLYTEHTFAYHNHPDVWAEASPLTGEEILQLDGYCRERFIDLVPNQNSFGHMTRWLVHDRYRPLAEVPSGGYVTRWGYYKEPYSLCPTDPASLELVRSLLDELLPHFNSGYVNVGCDETIDLGLGRSRDEVQSRGEGRVYLEFLLKIYREVKARGRTMQFWGDIIMEHPELVPELPHDAIALEWGYEANHPFDEHGRLFAASGVPFYVCPGTSSWNSVAGRTANAIGNLQNAAENGLQHGAVGFLNTDWGDYGHWQPLPVSYLGFAYGAALSWAQEANRDLDIARAISRYAFEDPSGTMGAIAYDLGNAGEQTGVSAFNASILFLFLQLAPAQIFALWRGDEKVFHAPPPNRLRLTALRMAEFKQLTPAGIQQALQHVDELITRLDRAQLPGERGELVQREYGWAARMLRHACRRARWLLDEYEGRPNQGLRQELLVEADDLLQLYRSLWLARNRPGGFRESIARMEVMRQDYED